MPTIVPAILEKNINGIDDKLGLVKNLADYVQIDIIDSWPSGENTISLEQLSGANKLRDFEYEIHLMVKEPINYLDHCRKIGAKMVYGQIEWMADQKAFLGKCRALGIKAGLSLDLPTFINKLNRTLLPVWDGLLLMAIEAGAQGRSFSRPFLGKIRRLVRMKKDSGADFVISVDGGINPTTAAWCMSAGVNQLCVGSYLLKSQDIKQSWQELRRAASPTSTGA